MARARCSLAVPTLAVRECCSRGLPARARTEAGGGGDGEERRREIERWRVAYPGAATMAGRLQWVSSRRSILTLSLCLRIRLSLSLSSHALALALALATATTLATALALATA